MAAGKMKEQALIVTETLKALRERESGAITEIGAAIREIAIAASRPSLVSYGAVSSGVASVIQKLVTVRRRRVRNYRTLSNF